MQPACQGLAAADGGGVASKHQEGGLESVLGVLLVTQHAPAHPQHHPAVARHQRGERSLVAPGREVVQELAVGSLPGRPGAAQGLEVPQERAEPCGGHGGKSLVSGSAW
jgi:hypothetical protein